MKHVWNTLIVLGVLLCMIMSLGVTADAAEGDAVLFAVSDTQLASDSINMMNTQAPGCFVLDVNGLADGQDHTGYSAAFVASQPMELPTDYTAVWPGVAASFMPEGTSHQLILVGVDETTTAEQVAGAIGGYLSEDACVIAVGPSGAASVIGTCADVDVFVTSGLTDDAAIAAAASAVGAAQLVNVGKDAEYPVAMVTVSDAGASAQSIPVPQPVADPNVGPVVDETAASEDVNVAAIPEVGPAEVAATETYSVIYDGNGKDENTFVSDDHDIPAGTQYQLRENGYTRAGYDFAGWTLDGTGDDLYVYYPGDVIIVNDNITVYAKWTPSEVPAEPAPEEPAPAEPAEMTDGEQTPDAADVPAAPETVDEPEVVVIPEEPEGTEGTEGTEGADPADANAGGDDGIMVEPAPEGDKAPEGTGALYAISFDANGGSGTMMGYEAWDSSIGFYFSDCAFTAPEGQQFAYWTVNDDATPHYANDGNEFFFTGDTVIHANWEAVGDDAAEEPPEQEPIVEQTYKITYTAGEGNGEPVTVDFGTNDSPVLGLNSDNSAISFVAPEGKKLGGWKVLNDVTDDYLYDVNNPYHFPEGIYEIAMEAQWVDSAKFAITFDTNGSASSYGPLEAEDGQAYVLPGADILEAPEGAQFVSWLVTGNVAGETVTDKEMAPEDTVVVNGDITVKAQWSTDAETAGQPCKVVFQSGVAGVANVEKEVKTGEQITVTNDVFTRDGYVITGWQRDDGSVLMVGDALTIPENTEQLLLTAQWAEKSAASNGAATTGDVTFTQGGTDEVALSYAAVIDTVSVDGLPLSLNSQYGLRDDNKTLFFGNSYLNSLTVGTHSLKVTFKENNGTAYGDDVRNLVIKANPQPAQTTTITQTWDRAYNWSHDFTSYNHGAPTKVEIYYGGDDWRELGDKYRTISGNTLTMLNTLLGPNWKNIEYTFRVTMADGQIMTLKLTVTGSVAPTATAAPTATPNGPTSPATGDTNNVTLYIVILAVLIAALAAVLIIVMKRRRK